MESNTNNISCAGLHGLDQHQRRSETSEKIEVRQGQNALGSLSLSTGLMTSHNRAERDCGSFYLQCYNSAEILHLFKARCSTYLKYVSTLLSRSMAGIVLLSIT